MSNQRGTAITRRVRTPRLALSVLVASVLALGATALTDVGVASASTLDGVATIASPSNDAPLTSGGSTTLFTVTLPANAACSGDTASDGYHIYSYLVQQGSSVAAVVQPLTFTTQPSAGYGLLDSSGTYLGPPTPPSPPARSSASPPTSNGNRWLVVSGSPAPMACSTAAPQASGRRVSPAPTPRESSPTIGTPKSPSPAASLIPTISFGLQGRRPSRLRCPTHWCFRYWPSGSSECPFSSGGAMSPVG